MIRGNTKEKFLSYATPLVIALAGIGFLLFALYYIIYLPVPAPLQPLKVRILTALQMEEALRKEIDMVSIGNMEEEISVFGDPDEEADVVGMIVGGRYEKLDEVEGWVKIETKDGAIRGWIKGEYILQEGSL